jgi:hypothetical protein
MGGQAANAGPKPANMSELLYQIQRFHSFLWASGGVFNDYNIHQIDECCWMKDGWPVKAQALGGRHYRGASVDQNFDNSASSTPLLTEPNCFFGGRCETGCKDEFASYVQGTKGCGIISTAAHTPGRCRLFKGQNISRADMTWALPATGEESVSIRVGRPDPSDSGRQAL